MDRSRIEEVVRWPLPGLPAHDPRIADRAKVLRGLERWLEAVRVWNRKIDLTAAKTDDDLVELALQDAVEIAGRLDPRVRRLVDVGPGFGAPGLAVAILRPDLAVTLVEPLGKRATFLRTVVGALGEVSRIEIRQAKGESLAEAGETFDAAISRATLAPPAWLALGDLLAPAGEVVLLLAREEVPASSGANARELSFRVDYATRAGAPRSAVGLVRRHR